MLGHVHSHPEPHMALCGRLDTPESKPFIRNANLFLKGDYRGVEILACTLFWKFYLFIVMFLYILN